METIKLHYYVEADGILQIQMPINYKEKDVEVVVVIQALETLGEAGNQSSGKKLSITEIIEGFRALRQEIPFDNLSVREMIEEGRRF